MKKLASATDFLSERRYIKKKLNKHFINCCCVLSPYLPFFVAVWVLKFQIFTTLNKLFNTSQIYHFYTHSSNYLRNEISLCTSSNSTPWKTKLLFVSRLRLSSFGVPSALLAWVSIVSNFEEKQIKLTNMLNVEESISNVLYAGASQL